MIAIHTDDGRSNGQRKDVLTDGGKGDGGEREGGRGSLIGRAVEVVKEEQQQQRIGGCVCVSRTSA
jgi:hypothetical protein